MGSRSLTRTGAIAIAATALVAVAFLLLLPWIASTQLVRDRIAVELTNRSGYRVTIERPPEIELWPVFRAVLPSVTLSPWGEGSLPPVIEAERVEVDLSPWAALRGEVAFSHIRLVDPTLRLDRLGASGAAPALPAAGRLAMAIADARRAVEENGSDAPVDAPGDGFGRLSVENGRVVTGSDADERVVAEKLVGEVSWPSFNGSGSARATGVWRGEAVSLDMSSAAPLLLFAGGEAPLILTFESAPLSVSFDGVADLSAESGYFEGDARFAAHPLRRALDWWEAAPTPATRLGEVTIASRVLGDATRIKFEEAEIVLDGNPAVGAIELAFRDELPAITGTLAFETLDLPAFLSAFTPLVPDARTSDEAVDNSFAGLASLDLRLSAARANAGAVALTEVAATAQVRGALAAFDISGAKAFGGEVQAGIRFDRGADGVAVEARLLASEVSGAALGQAAGLTRLTPTGLGTVSVILKGRGTTWRSILSRANGSVSAVFGEGQLDGFDLAGFEQRMNEGGFFPLEEASGGVLPIQSAELKATIKEGIARVEKAEARAGDRRISLSGLAPIVPGGLALRGAVDLLQDGSSTPGPSFFIGGSWHAPYISPAVERPD